MAVTLNWVLAQRELHLRLVSGTETQEPLTWAHAIDLVDPTPWLTGGELVLTTGLQLERSIHDQQAYVDRLADAGVAGLGFGVGVRFAEIPPAIVDACSRRGLPLVEVPLPTPFIAVTQVVARRLSEQEVESLQQAVTNQRRIIRSAVRAGLGGLVGALHKELHCDALVFDEYGAVMASSTRQKPLLEVVSEEWRRLSADARRRGTVGVATENGTLEIQTLRGRSKVVGWLAVHHGAPLAATDRLLLSEAAGLITLQLDWPAELIAAYHSLGGTLLDLLLDAGRTADTLVHHLRDFGFEAADPVMLAAVTAPRGLGRLLEVVSESLERAGRPHVVSQVDGEVAALVRARDARALMDVLTRALHDAGARRVVIGVSGSLPQTAAAIGLTSAEQAAAAARRQRREIGWFDELMLGAVIADEAVRSRIWTLAEPALEGLIRDSTPRDSELLPSLGAFLHCNGSWETAARLLGVHRHTLRARMSRVEELTGLSLDVAENRVLLVLALMSRPHGWVKEVSESGGGQLAR